MAVSRPSIRFDLMTETAVPSEPLAIDVKDGHGRLIVKAGQPLTQSLLGRLLKMGILEVFLVNKESQEADYWDRWGKDWYKEISDRLILLEPEGGLSDEAVVRFKRVLSEVIAEVVRQKGVKPES